MPDAFVNIIVDPGAVQQAADTIDNLDEVASAHLVTGEYDVVAQLDLADPDDLPQVVAQRIHSVPGVVDTVTHVAYEP